MEIGHFIRDYVLDDGYGRPAIPDGIKIISQYVKLLVEIGYEVLLVTENMRMEPNLTELNLYKKPTLVKTDEDILDCDIYVGSLYCDVKRLFQMGKGRGLVACHRSSIVWGSIHSHWNIKLY